MRKFSSGIVAERAVGAGTQGTPAAFIARIADTLSPIRRIVSGFGPTKMKPLFSTRSAKSAFSERKP